MKIFFTASQRGKKTFGENYEKIFHYIEELGHTHVDKMILEKNPETFYEKLGKKDYEYNKFLYDNAVKQIKRADVVIFECSYPSLSLGFMIEKALGLSKPVVILYLSSYQPYFLAGMEDERLQLIQYNDDDLKKKLHDAVQQAKASIDTRFNFFISSTLLTYLNKSAKEQGLTKSTFIRNLILEHRKKHPYDE